MEVTSALTRRVREGTLTPTDYAQAQNAFRADCLTDYELVTAIGDIIDQANHLLERHPLRAYDAVHLATAVMANQQLLANNLAPGRGRSTARWTRQWSTCAMWPTPRRAGWAGWRKMNTDGR